ncbi:Response regulator receiver domain protein [Desulfamplus magnetovallimortis]|uniref:Response regulator receiver domain protein n=1 Tax=Desulfamplus magnetovallimortis TaxID=1246637 RepID=A0A1W1HFP6_9BACT|nr:response regulator [Desulfamplus magnetovallimortis]SLM31253.1 Response regulator receiver domain protein [Desulfamplus magnetovallimortis]
MAIISITGAKFTHSDETVAKLSEKLGYKIITDQEIMEETAQNQDIQIATIHKVVDSKQIPFNDFTHEKEKTIAALRKTLALHISQGNTIFNGILGHLIPSWTTHALRVLIVTDRETRIQNGIKLLGVPEKDAAHEVNEADKHTMLWVNSLTDKKAWDKSLYDIVIPSDKLDVTESVELISKHHETMAAMSEDLVKKEASDFALAADVSLALAETGSGLIVTADNGDIVVTIDKNVLFLSKLKQKITTIAKQIPGVKSVDTKIGKNYYKAGRSHNFDFETPLHVLLVDDEKEFVQTLSERLKMRQISSNVVFSGQEALDSAHRDETEVMVLDLKMPGIDGFEVLRKIKQTKPHIEVIILTGHGSEADKATCMELGAFAYLQKPADIDQLAETMKKAYEKINQRKQNEEDAQ